jgi:hypothetical protein
MKVTETGTVAGTALGSGGAGGHGSTSAPSTGGGSAGASSTTTGEFSSKSVKPEGSLLDWRFEGGLSWCSTCKGGKWGGSVRGAIGPTVTDAFTPYFEVGTRFYENATYLDLAFAPAFWWTPSEASGWYLSLNPVLGVAFADLESETNHGRRFQFLGGGEAGFWLAMDKPDEASANERRVRRLGELASEYRILCSAEGEADDPGCKAIANRMEVYLMLMGNEDSCKRLAEILKDKAISVEELDLLEACAIRVQDRKGSEPVRSKVGLTGRLSRSAGRGLPSASAVEIGLGLAF